MVAAALYGVADLVFSWNPIAAAPYVQHRHAPAFRRAPALDFGLVAEAVNGWIAALAFVLVEPALRGSPWRRGALFGMLVWGFWIVSGTMSVVVWLDVPDSVAAVNVAFGLPKCLVIGCGMAWFRRLRGPE